MYPLMILLLVHLDAHLTDDKKYYFHRKTLRAREQLCSEWFYLEQVIYGGRLKDILCNPKDG
jgi:hypothetical protein